VSENALISALQFFNGTAEAWQSITRRKNRRRGNGFSPSRDNFAG
jgi:hypothetical protein